MVKPFIYDFISVTLSNESGQSFFFFVVKLLCQSLDRLWWGSPPWMVKVITNNGRETNCQFLSLSHLSCCLLSDIFSWIRFTDGDQFCCFCLCCLIWSAANFFKFLQSIFDSDWHLPCIITNGSKFFHDLAAPENHLEHTDEKRCWHYFFPDCFINRKFLEEKFCKNFDWMSSMAIWK